MVHDRFAPFLRLETHAPDLDDVLTPPEQVAVRRYITGLHDPLAGDNEWEHTSGRSKTTDWVGQQAAGEVSVLRTSTEVEPL
ncbi:hypothetical protein [Streptomyces sp. NRRL F-2580]|uniref:hypothetical protein n=1 Tax=Streptomyces sp. NRRL F-2580 TaxID=1463841 RepID=UPI0004C507CF|nr:hypothetical protein [Streptomyces sp. NRRL F-2580]